MKKKFFIDRTNQKYKYYILKLLCLVLLPILYLFYTSFGNNKPQSLFENHSFLLLMLFIGTILLFINLALLIKSPKCSKYISYKLLRIKSSNYLILRMLLVEKCIFCGFESDPLRKPDSK